MQSARVISEFDNFCAELLQDGEIELASRPETDVARWVVAHIMRLHFIMQREKDKLVELHNIEKSQLGFIIYSRINEYKEKTGLRSIVESENT